MSSIPAGEMLYSCSSSKKKGLKQKEKTKERAGK
jgi:hypothetical protein